jgi:hypothetical protein
VTDKLIAAMKGMNVVRDGLLWFATVNPDHGLLLLLGGAGAPRFKRAVKEAQSFSLEKALAPPPGLAPATVLYDKDLGVSYIGAIKVQTRFIETVRTTHPSAEWQAPRRAIDGPCRAVFRGRVVAVVMGIPCDGKEKEEARARGMIPEKLEPATEIDERSFETVAVIDEVSPCSL